MGMVSIAQQGVIATTVSDGAAKASGTPEHATGDRCLVEICIEDAHSCRRRH
jgi:hypothetical protein